MATQTLAQVRAAVKAAHPNATTAAFNATARSDYKAQQAPASASTTHVVGGPVGGTPTPTTAVAPVNAASAAALLPYDPVTGKRQAYDPAASNGQQYFTDLVPAA